MAIQVKKHMNRDIHMIRCENFLPPHIQVEIRKILCLNFNIQKTVMHEKL